MRSATVALVAVVALTVSACGGSHEKGAAGSISPEPDGGSPKMTSTPSPPSQTTPIALGSGESVPLGANIGPVSAAGRMLYFPAASRPDANWDSVASVDLVSHERREVARTQRGPGLCM
jgi:hypothetical protein